MGFFGVGQRSVGSRHLRDYSVVNRTVGSDAITTSKIAADTIIEVDIAPGAIGSHLIATNAISYPTQVKNDILGSQHLANNAISYSAQIKADLVGSEHIGANALSYATQIKDDLIGSQHLGADAISYAAQIKDNIIGSSKIINGNIISVKIANDAVGSQSIDTSAISYETQVKANVIGYGRITTGLQGSLGLGAIGFGSIIMDKLQLRFDHGRVGSITNYNPQSHVLGSVKTAVTTEYGLAFQSSTNRLWTGEFGGAGYSYLHQVGTTTGNIIGSVKVSDQLNQLDMDFATDTGNLWLSTVAKTYLIQVNPSTGGELGSIKIPNAAQGLAFASDKGRLWYYNVTVNYIYQIGTTTGNVIGSFVAPPRLVIGLGGLAFDSDKNRLLLSNRITDFIYEIGTTTGNIIGSFRVPSSYFIYGLAYTTDKKTWAQDISSYYFYKIGTAFGRGYPGTYVKFATPFAKPPTVTVGQIEYNSGYPVHISEPSPGSFWIKAGTYPTKAMWMAWGSR